MQGIKVSAFYRDFKDKLRINLVSGKNGLNRVIKVPELNRPGLALAGYFDYFASKRVQVMGKVEMTYLKSLSVKERKKRIVKLFDQNIPCIIIARNFIPLPELFQLAEETNTPIFRSRLVTMNLINKATAFLDDEFAESTTISGDLMEVYGVGVLLRGKSGVGKSECALALIKRGHRLITDDVVRIRIEDGKQLIGKGAELTRHHMEIRGLGIINVQTLFGVGCVRDEKRIDLMITLEEWDSKKEYERLGLIDKVVNILSVSLPHVVIPVRPGRDIALLIETASLNQRLKWMGYHSAQDLNKKLLDQIKKGN
ncbi:MAG: HPr(Ser) kinase/phosphatase [Candidatus Ancaeobacter aquaticus]|nr:HPr(Ser) kinase/phosphatase [Candidatus Ancaeobacter aquaticus]